MKKGAFTLIEMLVVIAILMILLTILIPSLGSARENAKRTSCRSNLKQLGLAFQTYAGDHNGWFPLKNGGAPVYDSSGFLSSEAPFSQHGRLLFVGGYVRVPKMWVCPSDKGEYNAGGVLSPVTAYSDLATFTNKFNSLGNCSYMYIAGYGDKYAYRTGPVDPTTFAVLLDESNKRDNGSVTPGSMFDMEDDDNHGADYRNLMYADGHASAVRGPDVANQTIFPRTDPHDYEQVNSVD